MCNAEPQLECNSSPMAFSLWRVVPLVSILDNLRLDTLEQSTGEVNPLNYLGLTLALSFAMFSGLGVRKTEAVCYLGSTASFLWFSYWILYDVLVREKQLVQVNIVNCVGVLLSLCVLFIPKILSLNPERQITTEAAPKKVSMWTKKRKIAK
jgi:predicted membrane-bound spermidine synthase